MRFGKLYVICGLVYGLLGLTLGIVMASSHNYGQHVTHAHLLLIGLVLSVLYGVIHQLWLTTPNRWLARLQFGAHQLGAAVIGAGLFLRYGGLRPPQVVEPFLAVASLLVLAAMVLMLVMVLCTKR
ncbi:TonB-dependent receptor [Zobellella endophytica]|uniref:TonB-dependent receptor n=1 Tax=Zobellella endophytica TaxID=2116700 RepID=A0A2P7R772_9GAMM|nr:TonB-dependent receptor [Zobellella endophytica]PSJ46064.1 TonB-dependent receptor [Zobellella endophytica]